MPWLSRSLEATVANFRKRSLAREARTAKRLRALYRRAEKLILVDIRKLVAKVEAAQRAGLPVQAAWLVNIDSANELLARLRSHIDQFSMAAGNTVAGATQTAAIDGARQAAGMARAAGVSSGFRRLNEAQIVDLIGAMEPGSPLYDLFADLGPRATARARGILGEAATIGKNPRVVAKQLARNVQNLAETRALLIARTETMRASRSATLRSYRANSDVVIGWRWMSAKNSRTCPVCLAMDGKEFPLSVDFASHPACRCAATPITDASDPPGESGEEWFARQPEEVQRKILGPSKLALYKDGKLELGDLVVETDHPRWGKGRTEATLASLADKLRTPNP